MKKCEGAPIIGAGGTPFLILRPGLAAESGNGGKRYHRDSDPLIRLSD
jgi:hypothetical protein